MISPCASACHAALIISPADAVIYTPDPTPHWHALMVKSQREVAARAWLDKRGVYAFFPVKRERRHVRNRWVERESRYLPGYLFARFPGEPKWHKVFDSPFVHNAIRSSNGYPGRIHPDSLRAIRAMASVDDEIEARWHLSTRVNRGDRVRVRGGAFAGYETEVLEIVAGKARLPLTLLGRQIDVDLGQVEKVA